MAKNKLSNRRKKEGLFWFNKRTGQFRGSSDKNSPINYFQPLEVYKAGEFIRRGESVSVATEEDAQKILKNLGADYDKSETYVVKTNTNYHKKSLGLALEPAEAGDELHIQNTGTFTFIVGSDSEFEYTPDWVETDIGKTIYVKGTSEESDLGLLTLDSEESWKEYRNIISIGSVTDTPLKNSTQTEIKVSLNISGDQRGLLDSTQIESIVGENFKVPLANPIKIMVVGQDEDTNLKGSISFRKTTDINLSPYFIGFSRADGKTAIIRFGNDKVPAVSETFDLKDLDTAFIRTAIYHGGEDAIQVCKLNFMEHTSENSDQFKEALKTALNEALTYIGCSDIIIEEKDIGNWINLNFEAAQTVLTNMHCSTECTFFQTFLDEAGSKENKGKSVVGDIRFGKRTEVLGVYASGHYDEEIEEGTHIVVQKHGLFRVPKNSSYKLIPGESYYLGFAGNIVTKNELPTYLSSVVKVGTAISETEFILEIGDNREYPLGSLPIGYIKPSVNNQAEFGFLLCDGVTQRDASEYPEVLTRLRQHYTDEQLGVQEIEV